ncbi:carcinoembryonic antigen-related cell adhesion molecule 6-like isoform X2 [Tupaia chinensis]|uniref:carcinoembryonic antigen-related cell adhesion molecule 6-like isoform X2 n=1 Tax=Tupaia chinensis TaxID=246437 RepID=UPI000FFC8F49|nr:carcinoembryonic antigen-related cell adhesion molecule 6-like isoform X2 [Tupaia chinensis]
MKLFPQTEDSTGSRAMERPSTSPHWGCTPWQELLLAVSLLTFWHLPITAQLTIKSEPFNATQGKDVLLSVYNVPVDVSGYQWYRGERVDRSQLILQYETNSQRVTEGPQYSGRKEIFSNGSLLLRNVRQEDSGFYTIHTITGIETDQASGQFRVFSELPKPFITSNNSHPMEDKDSVKLACEPETPDTTYRWWINGMSLPDSDRIVLTKDNRTLTLLSVTRTNKGPYGCETQNPVSTGRSDPITLDISYGPDPPTISPPDSNYPPGSNLSLSCHAASKPPAQYFWFLPRRPQQSTQVLFIPNIHKHDGGSYICLARNSATNLSRATIKNIVVIEEIAQGLPVGAIAGAVTAALFGVALVATLGYFLFRTRTGRSSVQGDLREHQPPVSTPGHGPSDSSSFQAQRLLLRRQPVTPDGK